MAEAGDTSLSALRKKTSDYWIEVEEEHLNNLRRNEYTEIIVAVCSREKAEAPLVQRLGGILREHVRTGC